jgi:hypothetical protein
MPRHLPVLLLAIRVLVSPQVLNEDMDSVKFYLTDNWVFRLLRVGEGRNLNPVRVIQSKE